MQGKVCIRPGGSLKALILATVEQSPLVKEGILHMTLNLLQAPVILAEVTGCRNTPCQIIEEVITYNHEIKVVS